QGSYSGTLSLSPLGSDDFVALSLPETLQVVEPRMQVSVLRSQTRMTLAPHATTLTVMTVGNTGDAPLNFAVASAPAWLVPSLSSGVVQPGAALRDTLRWVPGTLVPGSYTGSVILTSDDSSHGTVVLGDTLVVQEPLQDSSPLLCPGSVS